MKKGIMIWKEIIYSDVTGDEELMKVIRELEEGREDSDSAPTVVYPELDGTLTVSRRFFVSSEWDDE